MVKQHGVNTAGDTVRSVPFGFAFQSREVLGFFGRQTKKSCAHAFMITCGSNLVSLFIRVCVVRTGAEKKRDEKSIAACWASVSFAGTSTSLVASTPLGTSLTTS